MVAPTIAELLASNHKSRWHIWAHRCVSEPEVLNFVATQLIKGDELHARRAAEIFRHAFDMDHSIATPYLIEFVDRLKQNIYSGIKRGILHCMQYMDIPESLESEVWDTCFYFLQDQTNPIAVRVFAMTTLYNISKKYPELHRELVLEIERRFPHESPGFRSRGKKIIDKTWR